MDDDRGSPPRPDPCATEAPDHADDDVTEQRNRGGSRGNSREYILQRLRRTAGAEGWIAAIESGRLSAYAVACELGWSKRPVTLSEGDCNQSKRRDWTLHKLGLLGRSAGGQSPAQPATSKAYHSAGRSRRPRGARAGRQPELEPMKLDEELKVVDPRPQTPLPPVPAFAEGTLPCLWCRRQSEAVRCEVARFWTASMSNMPLPGRRVLGPLPEGCCRRVQAVVPDIAALVA